MALRTGLVASLFMFCFSGLVAAQKPATDVGPLVNSCVQNLIALQEDDGAWPYEGVYRVAGEIPVGYRVGGTAIVCDALLTAPITVEEGKSRQLLAVHRGLELILSELEDPLMKPSTRNTYDVRVWGHIYALKLFCKIKAQPNASEGPELVPDNIRERIEPWIEKLTAALIEQELEDGGWNYANRTRHAAFVTAPAVQALLAARELGQKIPDDLIRRSARVLKDTRSDNGAYAYSGTTNGSRAKLPGSIARSAVCEATLLMLDAGDLDNLQISIDAFHEYWDELEKRRKKTGTHKPPYGVAPYYFYYGHRYLAQAISLLPEEQQAGEYERFDAILMRTKDDDDTWNDRVFDRSKAFGTAMAVLALQDDRSAAVASDD